MRARLPCLPLASVTERLSRCIPAMIGITTALPLDRPFPLSSTRKTINRDKILPAWTCTVHSAAPSRRFQHLVLRWLGADSVLRRRRYHASLVSKSVRWSGRDERRGCSFAAQSHFVESAIDHVVVKNLADVARQLPGPAWWPDCTSAAPFLCRLPVLRSSPDRGPGACPAARWARVGLLWRSPRRRYHHRWFARLRV